jgi:hypothetical protein
MLFSKFNFGPDPTLHFKGMLAHSERPRKIWSDHLQWEVAHQRKVPCPWNHLRPTRSWLEYSHYYGLRMSRKRDPIVLSGKYQDRNLDFL